jgi:S-DNA-T family DNA segregation ATPase FtsK/SpoIIIE
VYLDRLVSLPRFLWSSRTSVALGQFVDGSPAVFDLVDFPHLLIAGRSGAGKSICLDTIMTCLLLKNTPAQLKLILADPVGLDFVYFADAPHSLNPVITAAGTFLSMLQWVDEEMERRAYQFSERNVRNIRDFNAKAPDQRALPLILIVINELPDLVMPAASIVLQRAFRKLQVWHRVGIHAIFVTRRPQARAMADLVQACPVARIAFRVADRDDSIAVLDADGAQELLGRGDMLLKSPGEAVLLRIQGSCVREDEIKRVVDYWRRACVSRETSTLTDTVPES